MEDRRSYLRYPAELDVKLNQLDGTSDRMDATVVNVSFGGMGIITNENLQPGTDVSVEWLNAPFYFAGDAVLNGTVVSIETADGEDGSFRLSVKFSDKDSELVQRLLHWAQTQDSARKRS
jgi:c-di-GMP-binding flagellar brake protein YcgR